MLEVIGCRFGCEIVKFQVFFSGLRFFKLNQKLIYKNTFKRFFICSGVILKRKRKLVKIKVAKRHPGEEEGEYKFHGVATINGPDLGPLKQ